MLNTKIREFETLHETLSDEHEALKLAFTSLEAKLRNSQVMYLGIFVI